MISLHPVTSKSEHYRRLFIANDAQPSQEQADAFEELLPLLPEPITLDEVILDLRNNFKLFSSTTAMLGEVGLDKAARVAFDYHASPRRLSPFTIPLDRLSLIVELGLVFSDSASCRPSLDSRSTDRSCCGAWPQCQCPQRQMSPGNGGSIEQTKTQARSTMEQYSVNSNPSDLTFTF